MLANIVRQSLAKGSSSSLRPRMGRSSISRGFGSLSRSVHPNLVRTSQGNRLSVSERLSLLHHQHPIVDPPEQVTHPWAHSPTHEGSVTMNLAPSTFDKQTGKLIGAGTGHSVAAVDGARSDHNPAPRSNDDKIEFKGIKSGIRGQTGNFAPRKGVHASVQETLKRYGLPLQWAFHTNTSKTKEAIEQLNAKKLPYGLHSAERISPKEGESPVSASLNCFDHNRMALRMGAEGHPHADRLYGKLDQRLVKVGNTGDLKRDFAFRDADKVTPGSDAYMQEAHAFMQYRNQVQLRYDSIYGKKKQQ